MPTPFLPLILAACNAPMTTLEDPVTTDCTEGLVLTAAGDCEAPAIDDDTPSASPDTDSSSDTADPTDTDATPEGEDCSNSLDDDGDTLIDCEDPDCDADPACLFANKVDILWVVDNSGSMAEEQALIANAAPALVSNLIKSGLDWHMGVVTTDMAAPAESGKLQSAFGYTWVDASVPKAADTFAAMIQQGTLGFYQEQGRAAAYAALIPPLSTNENVGFYRDDAVLHVVFMSDEDDQSGTNATLPVVTDHFNTGLKPQTATEPRYTQVHGIIGLPGNACGADPGTDHAQLVTDVLPGGLTFDVCSPNWAPYIDDLADAFIDPVPYVP
ncbi:MAG: hypothetical protein ACON5B_12170 [Myxococcota bacterium]